MKAQLFKFIQSFFVLVSLILFVGCGSGTPTASTITPDTPPPIIGLERSEPGEVVSCDTCCRRCVTGKACGNSCINVNYECYQPPGCACNKVEDRCYLPTPETTPSPSPTPDPCAPSLERSLSSADPAFYIASCPISPNPIDCYLTAIALIQQGVLIADPTSAYSTEAALLEFFEAQVRELENNPQPTPSPSPSSSPSPEPFPSPCPVFTPTPTPTPCQRPSYPTYCPGYWSRDQADDSTLDPPICELPKLPPQLECYSDAENIQRKSCYSQPSQSPFQSHHIIQEAAVRGILNYGSSRNRSAQSVLLPDSRRGTPHYLAGETQRNAQVFWTLSAEIQVGIESMLSSQYLSATEVDKQINCARQFFLNSGFTLLTPTNCPVGR